MKRREQLVHTLVVVMFWSYLLCLVVATHVPSKNAAYLLLIPQFGPFQADKVNHCVAYAVLGLLAALAFRGRTFRRTSGLLILLASLSVFAALDELTQPFFGRGADLTDWIYDLGGIACGIACGAFVRRHKAFSGSFAGESP